MVAASQAGLIPDLSRNWTNLKVTWSPVPENPLGWGFNSLPRKLSDNKDWELRDDLCATSGGKFLGQRYWYKKDATLNLLFDKNGYIAGIQNSVEKSKFKASASNKNFVDDGDYWTMTAYFIDPSLICGTGRTEEEFTKSGTGTGLWIQTGPNPLTDVFHAPEKENEIKQTKWGSGKCFYTMGQHYWYNITKDMDCDADLVPNCILYNGGKLTSFCFAINGYFDSKRFDWPHPKKDVINKFMDPVPDCFANNPAYSVQSTIHVYFVDAPQITSWC